MRSPAFRFYADDFMAGTIELSQAEVGAYIRLLCHQWNRGSIPVEPDKLARLAGGTVSDDVLSKFPQGEDGLCRNARLELERQKQDDFRELQRKKGISSAKARQASVEPRLNPGSIPVGIPVEPGMNLPFPSPSPFPASPDKTPLPPSTGAESKPVELKLEVQESKKPRKPRKPKVDMSGNPGFLAFWEAYPKKVGKIECARLWAKLDPNEHQVREIVSGVNRQKATEKWMKDGGEYIMEPERFLRNHRWEDMIGVPETKQALGERLRSMRGYHNHVQHCYATEAEKAEYAALLERYQAMPE